ncbi:hemolysin family protein [Jeotgalibacillus proteolyticus]|uniref:Transporter associated domain protein n=1 Tax=Jeotgalibacillus proteolyticus TaxID=2082395 RepID=A0A2S5G6Q7_9BACL|nr:hemolysin family protein [Jeotgalibacillus proteolyticus]PPA68669.1 transporter associated domain protein [Jeotgalibacillus proteolyticus]PPA68746.1 transporter associated domain protein [Jeotgalibacillus proteolyticus]
MDPIIILNLSLLVLLIFLTAFFVGSEFAVVKVRMSRIDQLISEGNKTAVIAKKLIHDLDYYLSACQLGITVTALGLGWLGKPTVERILYPVFDQFDVPSSISAPLSFIIAFSFVTFLHVVVGELAPKTLAIQYAEKMTLLLARPLYWFGKLMYPLIWTLNGSARLLLRAFGVQPAGHEQAHSEEELKIIMSESFKGGEINQNELLYLNNIFTFDDRDVKDIMVPRIQMITIDQDMGRDEIIRIFDEHQYTRYPVTEKKDKDRTIGFVNVKEMLLRFANGVQSNVTEITHDLIVIHESTSVKEVLLKMQTERVPIALVIDDFGGTAGLVTMEDILEEIVGDIRDEFDGDELAEIQKINETTYHLQGRVLLDELEEQFNVTFENRDDVDTVGGYIQRFNEENSPAFTIKHNSYLLTVLEIENYQVLKVLLELLPEKK